MFRVAKPIRVLLSAGVATVVVAAGGAPAWAQFAWQSTPEQTIETWVRELVARAREAARFGLTREEHKESAKPEAGEPAEPKSAVAGISEKSVVPKVSDVVLLPENGSRFAGIGGPGDIVALKSNGEVLAVTTVAQSGQWSVVVNSQLEPGDYRIFAATRDDRGAGVVVGDEVRIRIPSGYFKDRPQAFGRLAARQKQDAQARFQDLINQPPLPQRKPLIEPRSPAAGKLAQGTPAAPVDSPATPPARRPIPGVRPGASDEWLKWGFEWLERSAQTYNSEIVEKLKQGRPGLAEKPQPAETAADNRPAAPSAPPGPGRSFEFMSFVDALQDWLSKAQRDYQNEVAEKLAQPSESGVAGGQDDEEKARAAEALRKAEADRARAEAKRAGDKQAEANAEEQARRRAEEARKLAEVERLAAVEKRKREDTAKEAEAKSLQDAQKQKTEERARELAAKAAADAREKALREKAASEAREAEAKRKAAEVARQREADAKRKAEAEALARQRAEQEKRQAEAEAAARRAQAERVAAEAAKKKAAAEAEARQRQQLALRDAAREAERAKEAAARAAVAALKAEEAAKQAEEQRERDRKALREAEAALAKARKQQSAAQRANAQRIAREEARKAEERRALAEIARQVAREREAAKARATREAEAAVAAMRRAEAARTAQDAAASQAAKDRARARAEANARQAMEAAKRAQAEEKAGEERARALEQQLLARQRSVAQQRDAARKRTIAEGRRDPPPLPQKAPVRTERVPVARAPQPLPRKAPARRVREPAAKSPASETKPLPSERVADVPRPPPSPYRSRTLRFAQDKRSSLGARRAIYRPKRKRKARKRRVAYRPTCARAGRDVSVPGMYVVRRGDTLWAIARRHYGRGIRYHAIYRANKGKIRDPHWIYPCQKFWLPKLRNH